MILIYIIDLTLSIEKNSHQRQCWRVFRRLNILQSNGYKWHDGYGRFFRNISQCSVIELSFIFPWLSPEIVSTFIAIAEAGFGIDYVRLITWISELFNNFFTHFINLMNYHQNTQDNVHFETDSPSVFLAAMLRIHTNRFCIIGTPILMSKFTQLFFRVYN